MTIGKRPVSRVREEKQMSLIANLVAYEVCQMRICLKLRRTSLKNQVLTYFLRSATALDNSMGSIN